jgi:lipopolysaccharide export system permease protein
LAIGSVAALRLIGFASTAFGVHTPFALIFQYVAVIAAVGFGLFAVSRGMIIEPPAAITNAIDALAAHLTRLTRRTAAT